MTTAQEPETRASCPGDKYLAGLWAGVGLGDEAFLLQLGLFRAWVQAGPRLRFGEGTNRFAHPTGGWSKGKESFAFSFSSTSDTELDAVVGFYYHGWRVQLLKKNFMNKPSQEFEDMGDNKFTCTRICFLVFFLVFIYFWERERASAREYERGSGREMGDTESKADSRLWAVSIEPDAGLKLPSHEIIT